MSEFSLTTEIRPGGVTLFNGDEEVGIIKREEGLWTVYVSGYMDPDTLQSPISFHSLQAAEYHALAIYIETVWLNEGIQGHTVQ